MCKNDTKLVTFCFSNLNGIFHLVSGCERVANLDTVIFLSSPAILIKEDVLGSFIQEWSLRSKNLGIPVLGKSALGEHSEDPSSEFLP